jgi:hypothetical protein
MKWKKWMRRYRRNPQTSLPARRDSGFPDAMAEFTAPSAVDLDEAELCRWLFAQPFLTAQLCAKLGVSGSFRGVFETNTKRFVANARGPGDIDILVCDPAHPEATTVIEAKRVKISEATFSTKAPTKLDACARGVRQANLLGALGFHRTWLLVAAATDGRNRPGANFFSRGITFELMDIVRNHPSFADLASHVGLIFVFLDQPVDKDIALAGSFGFDVRREPTSTVQSAPLTPAVRDLFTVSQSPTM